MQYAKQFFNPAIHEQEMSLSVKNPYATLIATGAKRIEVRSKRTTYRGRLVICASQHPVIEGMDSGCTVASVELYDVKPLEELTEDEWLATCIPEDQWKDLKGYGWFLRNPKRLIPQPASGQLGIWTHVRNRGEFIEYPDQNDYQSVKEARESAEKIIKHLSPDLMKAQKHEYDAAATKKGCIIIIIMFLIGIGIIIGAVQAFIHYFGSIAPTEQRSFITGQII